MSETMFTKEKLAEMSPAELRGIKSGVFFILLENAKVANVHLEDSEEAKYIVNSNARMAEIVANMQELGVFDDC